MPKKLQPHCKLWLEKGGDYAFGGGIADILAAIRTTGSIKEASGLLGESYRYVWGRIQKTEHILGIPLVETMVGGQGKQRCRLTKFGQRILDAYRQFETHVQKTVRQSFIKMKV